MNENEKNYRHFKIDPENELGGFLIVDIAL
jgi:hypothetical protein